MLLQTTPGECSMKSTANAKGESDGFTHVLDYAPAPGWTVHVTKEGRLFYCNHLTRSAGWLPPIEAWRNGEDALPYGWERAVDDTGKSYYINHVNKTTTYETPLARYSEPLPIVEARTVHLERSPNLGFGFVAGSEKPVIVRFVTEGGPSAEKLLPGDQILAVNNENVKKAPREHVISLVRACSKNVTLVVCQPSEQTGARKSTLLSSSKKARLKNKPFRVRFAESVCVNGAPLFPASAFSLGDVSAAPMANVLKVFLENGQTKSFKYDAWTTVQDVTNSLKTKLQLLASEHFSLVVEHIKSAKRNKLTLLDPQDTLARIASRPGAYKLRCLFRVTFVPSSPAALAQQDLNSLDYLYTQCCNDVIQERFAPELQCDTALRLAALHIYQHSLGTNIGIGKLTMKTIEKDFGFERFVPTSILENMKRKELRKLIAHFLKLHLNMTGPGKQLTALQCKLYYLDIVSQLPSYGAKCFSTGRKADLVDKVILVSPKFGISQITGTRNSVPVPIANIEDMHSIEVRVDDEINRTVLIKLQCEKIVSISLDERDAVELVIVLKGYYLITTGQTLLVDQEEIEPMEDLAPPYLSQHKVMPEKWSFINPNGIKTTSFAVQPGYQGIKRNTNGLYNTVGRQTKTPLSLVDSYRMDSNMNNSIPNRNHLFKPHFDLKSKFKMDNIGDKVEPKMEEVIHNIQEMQIVVENSVKYLSEQQNLESSAEWQESNIDFDESDTDDSPGKLKHSDSLLLLNRDIQSASISKNIFSNAAIELLRSEISNYQSESDNESLMASPHNSPRHKINELKQNSLLMNRVSFGLRSPDTVSNKDGNFQEYLKTLKNSSYNKGDTSVDEMYVYDSDIIDLTLLPPPATPDELDCALPVPLNVPPTLFADSCEKLDQVCELAKEHDLDKFLKSVSISPPTMKITPSVELTPEEINSFIIPPPPLVSDIAKEKDNLKASFNDHDDMLPSENKKVIDSEQEIMDSNIIDYSTIDKRGAFSCCSKPKRNILNVGIENNRIDLPMRRCSDERPPDRPPKTFLHRERSHSLTNSSNDSCESRPKLPPRGDHSLFYSLEKPPLPPVPSLEVSRIKKKQTSDIRTAGIGSPHLQRNKDSYNQLEINFSDKEDRISNQSPSPHLGREANVKGENVFLLPNRLPCKQIRYSIYTNGDVRNKIASFEMKHKETEYCDDGIYKFPVRNGCSSTRENFLEKTDLAMSSLLLRLDQVAAQCTTAQFQGGGKLINEEKFQVTKQDLISQSLQLVTSSKMLVIAMSEPTLPDLPENLAICLTILRRLTELCQDLANHTTAPLQTRNLILKVHDVIGAFKKLITSDIDRSTQEMIEEQLAAQAEDLANVLATLLRILRVFSP